MADETSKDVGMAPDAMTTTRPREFDAAHYYRSNPDVLAGGADAFEHWNRCGQTEEREGQRPNWRYPRFAGFLYLETHLDVKDLLARGEFDSAADHWFRAGRWEVAAGTRDQGFVFDEDAYLADRPDVQGAIARGAYLTGLDYWLCWGVNEDRMAEVNGRFSRYQWPDTRAISVEKQAFWKNNGFVILEGAIPSELCDQVVNRLDELWTRRHAVQLPFCADIFLDRADHRRVAFNDAPDEAREHPFKISDMVLMKDVFRDVALHPNVAEALRWALDGRPCVVNSLNLERGGVRVDHTDTLFMPGRRAGGMIGAMFAFEDVSSDAGPMRYYAGSQDIPLYRFSTGLSNYIAEEWAGYLEHQMMHVDRLALTPSEYLPKKGDVLIWQETLFYGEASIRDMSLTHKSMVCHYWDADLMAPEEIADWNGLHYQLRPFLSA